MFLSTLDFKTRNNFKNKIYKLVIIIKLLSILLIIKR